VHLIAPTARISPLADLEDSVRGSRLVIEDDVFIDSFVKVKFAGGTGDVVIERGAYINSGCVIYSGYGVRIGKNVRLAAHTIVVPGDHEFRDPDRSIFVQGYSPSRGGVIIDDEAWIGAGAVLLDGTVVGFGAIVGANSVVRAKIEPYDIWAGTPARRIRSRRDGEPVS
jgi:acetyltransferase-like isoleucine patch superfamily enzyme